MVKTSTTTPILRNEDGTAVTAQEAYDAFMNTRVLIVKGDTTYEAISMVWYDNNSAHTDTTNVSRVNLSYVTKVGSEAVIDDVKVGY